MPRSKRSVPATARPQMTVAQLGRQLRAAFEPTPTGNDDFADLLAQLDQAERQTNRRQAAE